MAKEVEAALRAVEGLAEGLALNYLWETLALPGFGIPVTPGVPGFKRDVRVALGLDDVLETLAGVGIIAYGGATRDVGRVAQGIAFVTGIGLTKLFEAFGSKVEPVDPPASPERQSVPGGYVAVRRGFSVRAERR